ncbi:Type II secretion system protein F [Phycisphaerales bacterium]|nr:Type II secretion system protein F [Phycisphaerales bacterium]
MSTLPGNHRFLYLAAKPDGGRTFGVVRARDGRHLAEQLRRDRLVPLKTWSVPAWAPGSELKVNLKDQCEVHTQLAQLLNRAVPLVEALEVVSSAVGKAARPKIERMREMVAAGSGFADSAKAVDIFDPVTIAVYRAAERTGDLGGAAKQLATTARRQLAIAGKAGTLLIYPSIVMSISVLVSIFMITVILPQVGKAIEGAGAKLPTFTKVLMEIGLFLRGNVLWALLVVAVAITAAVFARRHITAVINSFSRVVPLLREVVMAQEAARFFTVMAAMTRSGITLADALGVAVGVLGHPRLRSQLTSLRTRLIEGGVLRQLIDSVDALPLATRRLLIAAERSGDLESAFETLAGDLAEELDRRSTRLLAALEPALIIFMFLMIGTLLLAIMIPLIKLSSAGVG